jgi:hypothetical protein
MSWAEEVLTSLREYLKIVAPWYIFALYCLTRDL